MDKKGNRPQPTWEYSRGSLHGTVSRRICRSRGIVPGGQGPEAKALSRESCSGPSRGQRLQRLRRQRASRVSVSGCPLPFGTVTEGLTALIKRLKHAGSVGMRPRLSPRPRVALGRGIKHATPKPHDPAKKKQLIKYSAQQKTAVGLADSTTHNENFSVKTVPTGPGNREGGGRLPPGPPGAQGAVTVTS